MTTTCDVNPRTVLSSRQLEILRYLAEAILNGKAPSVRDVGERFGIGSPNGVLCHLKTLEAKGLIIRDEYSARGIRLVGAQLALTYDDSPQGQRLQALLEGSETDARALGLVSESGVPTIGTSTLTEQQVRTIRRQAAEGRGAHDLARQYEVTRQTIRDVVARRTWRHVD